MSNPIPALLHVLLHVVGWHPARLHQLRDSHGHLWLVLRCRDCKRVRSVVHADVCEVCAE